MAIDVTKIKYRCIALLPDGRQVVLDDLLLSTTWEEPVNEWSARVRFILKNMYHQEFGWVHRLVMPSKRVLLQANDGAGWKEVFRGTVYRWKETSADTGTITITAYDPLYPLLQSKIHKYYRAGETAASCIKSLASEWNIPLGEIQGPNVKLAKKKFADSIGSIFSDRLEESRKKGGARFIVRSTQGKLEVIKESTNKIIYRLDQEVAEVGEEVWNIENLVTRVRIYGKEDKLGQAPVQATKDGKTEFGILQEILYSSAYDNLEAAKKAADELIEERGKPQITKTVAAPDIPWIRKGDKVYIEAGTIKGFRIVEGITHNIENMRMTLQVRE